MVRIPTQWTTNSTKNVTAVLYSSASVLYSDLGTDYVSATVGENETGKPATQWTQSTKTASAWQYNPAFSLNQYIYDSASNTYDSLTMTYDGVNGTQQSSNNKPATAWTVVS